ncbi:MAG: hypothetical protein OHK0039_44100 [Bacteroidia bacterium]
MPLPVLFTQLLRLHDLICRRATGDTASCAARLGISEATVYRYLRLLRALGGPIAFSYRDHTYYYTEPVDFIIGYRCHPDDKRSPENEIYREG